MNAVMTARRAAAGHPLRTWAGVLWCGLFLFMVAWSLLTPVGGGPDESGHIMKAAATIRGDFTGTPTGEQGLRSFSLPADIGRVDAVIGCFAGKPNQSAACAPVLEDLGHENVTVISGVAAYNPLYYAIVGLPSLALEGTAMVVGMRVVNAVLVSSLWAIAFATLAFRHGLAGFVVALAATPMALYLGGVVNPSGAEIAATAAVFGTLTALVRGGPGRPTWILAAFGGSVIVLVSMRSISPLFVAIAVVLVGVSEGFRRLVRSVWTRTGLVVALAVLPVVVFGLWWTLAVSAGAGFIPSSGGERPGRLEAFWHTIESFPNQMNEMIGVMGWFDAWPPPYVHVLWAGLIAGAVVLAYARGSRRALIAMALAGAALLLTPALLQASTASSYGYIWQGRYSIPLLVLLLGVAAATLNAHGVGRPVRFAVLAVALLVMQAATFLTVFKRYAAGAAAAWSELWSPYAWHPTMTLMGMAVMVAGLGITAVAVVMTVRRRPVAAARRAAVTADVVG